MRLWFIGVVFACVCATGCGSDDSANTGLDTDSENSDGGDSTDADAGSTADGGADTEEDADTDNCSDAGENDTASDGLEIIGVYVTDFGSEIAVTDDEWTDTMTMGDTVFYSSFSISSFDNDENFLVAKNSADNSYFPELWSRFDWTVSDEGSLYYCQSIYDAETEADAIAGDGVADSSDLDGGCAGYPWSELNPKEHC